MKNKKNHLTSLHHSGLINILICFELEQWYDTWDEILKRNQFETLTPSLKSIHQIPTSIANEVASPKAIKPSSPKITDDMVKFVVKYRQGKQKASIKETSKRKVQDKKRRKEDSSSPSEDKNAQQSIMNTKETPRIFTQSMARWKPQVAKTDESENPPIEIEEDSPARSPDSPPPVSPQQHLT
jgi:hypothetical protein